MKTRLLFVFRVGIALALLGTAAQASSITVTYTGEAYIEEDNAGYLSGGSGTAPFTLTYSFNPVPGSVTDNGITSQYSSSSETGITTLIINGIYFDSSSGLSPYSETDTASSGSTSQAVSEDLSYHVGGILSVSASATNATIPESIYDSYSILTGLSGDGSFFVSEGILGGALGSLEIQTLVVNGGVTPLPASLSLFATGLGALSLFGWRRKRKNTASSCVGNWG